VRIRVLGPMEVFDGHEWRPMGALKMRALLARLVIDAGRVVSVDQLADELWGASVPATVANQVHGYVGRLRRLLDDAGARMLVTRVPGYQLCLGEDECDAQSFAALAAQGRRTLVEGSADKASEQLTEALAQWRGDAYCDVPQTPAVQAEVLRLSEARLVTVEARIAADLACGRHAALIGELRGLTQTHPLRETLWHPYLLALFRSGRQADALFAYQQLCGVLDAELGVAPSQALRELRQSIVAAETAVTPGPRESLTPSQLPPDVGGFVGRRHELDRIDTLLTSGAATDLPIVTITGPAGVGKTALAVHWAHRTRTRFPDGQLYVNLEGFSPDKSSMDPAHALRGFLETLDVAPHRIPVDTQAQAALLRSLLADRRMTVLLDNARDADQVRPLLPGTASCAVVVTSRDPLSGLSTQFAAHTVSLDVLTETEARQLLVARLGERASAEPDDHFGQANLHYLRMWQAEDAGDFATALAHARDAWDSYRRARHDAGMGRALSAMGWLNALLGDYETARDQCDEALKRLRVLSDLTGQASIWDSLGLIHFRLGDLAAAARAYQTAIGIYSDLDDRYNIAYPLAGLAQVRRAQHDDVAAAATTRDALAALAKVRRHDDAAIRATLQPIAGP